MKKLLSVFILSVCATPVAIFAQNNLQERLMANSVDGYYTVGGEKFGPVPILKESDRPLSEQIMVFHGADTGWLAHTASETDGFEMGKRRFVSAKVVCDGVECDRFFEEVLDTGTSAQVYMYLHDPFDKPVYYIRERDGTFGAPIPYDAPQPLWDMILSVTDCDRPLKPFPKEATNQEIIRYWKAYGKCNPNLFPRFEFGVSASTGAYRPSKGSPHRAIYSLDIAFAAGLYAEIPLGGCWSFRPELNLFHVHYDKPMISKGDRFVYPVDFVDNSLQIPVMMRYSFNFLTGGIIPYAELGGIVNFGLQDGARPTLGYAVGIGCEWKIGRTRSLYTGLRAEHVSLASHSKLGHKYYSFNIGATIFGK